jgi:acetyl esterase
VSYIDLALFDGSQVPEDTRAVAAAVRGRIPAFPGWTAEHAKPLRAARSEGRGGFPPIVRSPRAETVSISGPAGELVLRVVAPESPKGAYLHIHGGGWFMGGADLQDYKLEAIADDADVACLSVEYRLAPENPYPAALDDCVAAASWLLRSQPNSGQPAVRLGAQQTTHGRPPRIRRRLRWRRPRPRVADSFAALCRPLELVPSNLRRRD